MWDTGWFKSTYSGAANDACVEVRISEVGTRVRDSKSPAMVLSVDIVGLVSAIKSGRFDHDHD